MKRIFAQESCSLQRLTEICETIDISIFDLLNVAKDLEVAEYTFNTEVEKFFSTNLNYFRFFRKLEYHRGIGIFKSEDQLDEKSIRKYLKKIENLGLIKILEGDRVAFNQHGYMSLPRTSELSRNYDREWTPEFFSKIISANDKRHKYLNFSTGLRPDHLEQLYSDINELSKKYTEIGFVDQKIDKEGAFSVGVVIGIGPYRIGANDRVPRIS